MKTFLIIIGIIIAVGATIILASVGMVYHISHRLDCEAFNIDNIELRTQTDIPALAEDGVCRYDPKLKVKANFFQIDTGQVDMHHYISRNHFKKTADSFPLFSHQKDWNSILGDINKEHLYAKRDYAIGEDSGNMDTWLYVLDSTTGKLWMEVVRSKHH